MTGTTRRRDLPVFPLTPDPLRPGVSHDALAVRLDIDGVGPEDGPRVALVTLGCDKNTVDSERVMAALVTQGARVVGDPVGADVVIVNICGFIQAAKEESIETILEGCDHTCAFCAIPLMRGLHRSAPLDELVGEAAALGHRGVREINVVSQDTTWYGRDLRRRDPNAPLLPELLEALLDRTGVDWYRLFYMYPSGITPELVHLLAEASTRTDRPRIVPYLDVPLQHGSDRMLAAMRRPERGASIRERVSWLRSEIAGLTLRTTVIVGFPGETEEDFRILLDLLEELRFDRLGAFAYSEEEDTPAAAMTGQVPEGIRRERLEELLDLQRAISLERNLDLVGSVQTALIDRRVDHEDPDFVACARTEGQAVEVDGVTWLLPEGAGDVAPGEFVHVEIVDAGEHDLTARVVGVDPGAGKGVGAQA